MHNSIYYPLLARTPTTHGRASEKTRKKEGVDFKPVNCSTIVHLTYLLRWGESKGAPGIAGWPIEAETPNPT
jgi:hypothetical protein